MKKRVTLDDIAAACDTSPATVSLALRNRAGVSRTRRAEIIETARRLGYMPRSRNSDADSKPVRNIGLIFRTPDWTAERTSPALNHFYSWVLTGIQDGANEHRMNLNLGTIPVDMNNHAATLPEMLLSQPLDGVLLVGAFQDVTVASVNERVIGDQGAMVLVDSIAPELNVDSVTSDHRRGMAVATRHLIEQGHQQIGFAGPPAGVDTNFDLRRAGYRDAMAEADLSADEIDIGLDVEDVQGSLIARPHAFTALACANDHTATLIIQAGRRVGIDVPGDLSLIGFDDTAEGRQSHPTITTMAVDKASMGLLAVKMLQYRLEWPDAAPMQMSLSARLIQRESVVSRQQEEMSQDGVVHSVAAAAT